MGGKKGKPQNRNLKLIFGKKRKKKLNDEILYNYKIYFDII